MKRIVQLFFVAALATGIHSGISISYATPPLPPPVHWPPQGLPVADQEGDQFTGDIIGLPRGGAIVAWTNQGAHQDSIDLYVQKVNFDGTIGWTHLPTGFPLCTAPGRQFMVRLISDGLGGAIATWYDERGASPDIYALRVRWDGRLYPGWPPNGFPVCDAPGEQFEPVIASDGNEGAYIAWEDSRDGSTRHVYVQHLAGEGSVEYGWPPNGIRVSNAAGNEFEPAITPCAEGGAFVTWVRFGAGLATGDLIATRITASGTIAPGWPDSGLVLCAAPGLQDMPSCVPDGQGGMYAVWRDYRDEIDLSGYNRSDIYAQRVTGSGLFPPGWGGNGVAVRVDTTDQWIPKIAPDGQGGLLVTWWSAPEVFVQRLTPAGTVAQGWDASGVSVGSITTSGQGPVPAADGSGGAIVAWNDYRSLRGNDIYAQRITADGQRAAGWPDAGAPVSTAPGDEQVGGSTARVSTIVSDGGNGALVAWTYAGTGVDAPSDPEVRVQRVTASGVVAPVVCYGCNSLMGLSPNPGTGLFRLAARMSPFQSRAAIEVYDVQGRRLRTRSYSGLQPGGIADLEIDLTGLPAGVYYVRLAAGKGMETMGTRSVVLVR